MTPNRSEIVADLPLHAFVWIGILIVARRGSWDAPMTVFPISACWASLLMNRRGLLARTLTAALALVAIVSFHEIPFEVRARLFRFHGSHVFGAGGINWESFAIALAATVALLCAFILFARALRERPDRNGFVALSLITALVFFEVAGGNMADIIALAIVSGIAAVMSRRLYRAGRPVLAASLLAVLAWLVYVSYMNMHPDWYGGFWVIECV